MGFWLPIKEPTVYVCQHFIKAPISSRVTACSTDKSDLPSLETTYWHDNFVRMAHQAHHLFVCLCELGSQSVSQSLSICLSVWLTHCLSMCRWDSEHALYTQNSKDNNITYIQKRVCVLLRPADLYIQIFTLSNDLRWTNWLHTPMKVNWSCDVVVKRRHG